VLADLGELRIERYQHRIRRRHERICGEGAVSVRSD
jgi:hypothetical protein